MEEKMFFPLQQCLLQQQTFLALSFSLFLSFFLIFHEREKGMIHVCMLTSFPHLSLPLLFIQNFSLSLFSPFLTHFLSLIELFSLSLPFQPGNPGTPGSRGPPGPAGEFLLSSLSLSIIFFSLLSHSLFSPLHHFFLSSLSLSLSPLHHFSLFHFSHSLTFSLFSLTLTWTETRKV